MGSSGEGNIKGIDASVGGLVWVRRRNGSWWPGRIMGLDELSEGCLVSPRSGTPVKLLGREDASIDWYNLEKSKRVKAFRCGEYDECIEKAKAYAASSCKKAVKYARREDAILHALELESERLGNGPLNFSCRRDAPLGKHGISARKSPSVSSSEEDGEKADDASDSGDSSDSAPALSQSGISFEESYHFNSPKVQLGRDRRRRTPNDSEDDGMEGAKRMRGLEDLGIGVAKNKNSHAGELVELVQQDKASLCDSNAGNYLSKRNPVNGSKIYVSSSKRKRSQVPNVHEFLKRKSRRRQLTKVLESTAMVSVPVICDMLPNSCGSPLWGSSDGRLSGLESNESKKSLSVVLNNNSDSTGVSCENGACLNASEASHLSLKVKENEISSISRLAEDDSSERLFDVPFVGEDKQSAGFSSTFISCSSGRPHLGSLGRQSSQSSQAEAVQVGNEGTNECGSTSSAEAHGDKMVQRIAKGTSKWQSKGKRNSRHINKNRNQDSRKYVGMDDECNACVAGTENSDGFSQGSDKKLDCYSIAASLSSFNCAKQVSAKEIDEDQADGSCDRSRHLPQREPQMRRQSTDMMPLTVSSPQSMKPLLPHRHSRFTVHSRYQNLDFPVRNFCSDDLLYDVQLEVKASYRPQHVPLVSLMSKLNGKAIVGHPLTVEVLDHGLCDILLSRIESEMGGGESLYMVKRNRRSGRVQTKQLSSHLKKSKKRKKTSQLSKKIRKLSSLTSHKPLEHLKNQAVEKPQGPVIACIPLKVVFSRINEAVNCLARQPRHALTSVNP